MKIGKDEIGPIGIIALILMAPSTFLTAYIFLTGIFLFAIIAAVVTAFIFLMYYVDLFEHRKKKQSR
ncbi:MAG: hypothetical protein NWF05_08920 [Candidatus Bathyarchaeota archaeon]|nr:hypothetical protein [Candidatus Bathyarchaeota archaeon]